MLRQPTELRGPLSGGPLFLPHNGWSFGCLPNDTNSFPKTSCSPRTRVACGNKLLPAEIQRRSLVRVAARSLQTLARVIRDSHLRPRAVSCRADTGWENRMNYAIRETATAVVAAMSDFITQGRPPTPPTEIEGSIDHVMESQRRHDAAIAQIPATAEALNSLT